MKNIRELSRRRGLYRVSRDSRVVELFKVKLSRVGIGSILKSRAWAFYSVGQELGPALRAVRGFCGWNPAVGGPQGRGLTTWVPPGADGGCGPTDKVFVL